MALVYLDSDPWILEHESCEKLYRQIVEQLNSRSRFPRNSDKYASISASIRIQMKQYATEVQQLKKKLDQFSNNLTLEETERRHRLIETLQSLNIQLQHKFHDRGSAKEDRNKLLGAQGVFKDMGTTGWSLDDDDDDEPLASQPLLHNASPTQIRLLQQKMLEDQDQGLERLSKVISRQKDIAVTIGNEVTLQNEIVDDIADRMDRTNTTIQRESEHIRVISRTDSTFGYWIVILLLFFAIIVVTFV
uniref:t-SNARE coiled-coil homology domain-containing protein n=1 Tax=Clastoptera arizonana TaxID=38151 RepID=A0A1B6C2F9_9HEMI